MYYVGIDLGGTNIKTGLVSEDGRILEKVSRKTFADRDADLIVADMAATVEEVCRKAGVPLEEVHSVGVGTPGACVFETGEVVYANNLPFTHLMLGPKLEALLKKPAFISNDANCAAYGEAVAGAAKGCRYVIMLTLGTGVGGGIIIDHKIYEGHNGAAAELGHMAVMKDGQQCTCGRRGCLEAYASATALIRMARHTMELQPKSLMWQECGGDLEKVNGRTAFNAMRAGDFAAKEVVQTYIGFLAEGITSYISIFQPEVILLGGGISNEGEALLAPLRERAYLYCYGSAYLTMPRIEKAALGNDAGIIGAAMLHLNRG